MAYTVEPRHYEVLGTIRIVVSGFSLFREQGSVKSRGQQVCLVGGFCCIQPYNKVPLYNYIHRSI